MKRRRWVSWKGDDGKENGPRRDGSLLQSKVTIHEAQGGKRRQTPASGGGYSHINSFARKGEGPIRSEGQLFIDFAGRIRDPVMEKKRCKKKVTGSKRKQ